MLNQLQIDASTKETQYQIIAFILESDPYLVNKQEEFDKIKSTLYSLDFTKELNSEIYPALMKDIETFNETSVKNEAKTIYNYLLNENVSIFRMETINSSNSISYLFSFYLYDVENPKLLIYVYDNFKSNPLYGGNQIYAQYGHDFSIKNKGEKLLRPGVSNQITVNSNDSFYFYFCITDLDFKNSTNISTVYINGAIYTISESKTETGNKDPENYIYYIIIGVVIFGFFVILFLCRWCKQEKRWEKFRGKCKSFLGGVCLRSKKPQEVKKEEPKEPEKAQEKAEEPIKIDEIKIWMVTPKKNCKNCLSNQKSIKKSSEKKKSNKKSSEKKKTNNFLIEVFDEVC